MMRPKGVTALRVHYSDGSSERITSGVLGHITPAGDVLVHTVGLDVPGLLTILVGLEEATNAILEKGSE